MGACVSLTGRLDWPGTDRPPPAAGEPGIEKNFIGSQDLAERGGFEPPVAL